MKEDVFVSVDTEADGPIPGPNSLLSFASAAYTADKQLVDIFAANLRTLPDAALQRVGIHTERGERTLEQLLTVSSNHIPHHVRFIHDKRLALGLK